MDKRNKYLERASYYFFSPVSEDCMKSKSTLVTFSTKCQLNRQVKILQQACDLSTTFNTCQKYLILPHLQLIHEAYLIERLAKPAAFRFGQVFVSSSWAQPDLSSFKKLKTRFHWVKSI